MDIQVLIRKLVSYGVQTGLQADNILVKRQQHLILMSPGIGSPVIRIRESADTGFISVVDRRCARPGHLDHNALPEHCLIDALLRSLGA